MNQGERQITAGMLCPTCKVDLVMTERLNIGIGIRLVRGSSAR